MSDKKNLINKITSAIMGTEKSEPAPMDSPVRNELLNKSVEEMDPVLSQRYMECSRCEELGETFKFHGVTISKKQPQCRACGCLIFGKLILPNSSCPLGKW